MAIRRSGVERASKISGPTGARGISTMAAPITATSGRLRMGILLCSGGMRDEPAAGFPRMF